MSNTPFVESQSSDPVERAIARKVTRMLNDSSLDRQQRETLINKAQRDLIRHRQQKLEQHQLRQHVAAIKLPQGFRPQSIQVHDGRVQVGLIQRHHSFTWLDAGDAPKGVAANHSTFMLANPTKTASKTANKDPIAARQRDLGLKVHSSKVEAVAV